MFLLQMFERETRREKILEARHRELKLKERAKSQQGGDKVSNIVSDIICDVVCLPSRGL